MKYRNLAIKSTAIAVLAFFFTVQVHAQKTVGLDNWFNHETNPKTHEVFHYTWDDTANSGFSQLGAIFREKGARLVTVSSAPTKKNLSDVDVYIIVDPDTTSENPHPNYILPGDIQAIINVGERRRSASPDGKRRPEL